MLLVGIVRAWQPAYLRTAASKPWQEPGDFESLESFLAFFVRLFFVA